MKYKTTISSSAQKDLEQIFDYTNAYWGANQAILYTDKILEKLNLINTNPEIGKSRDDIRKGYRSLIIKEHVVFYKIKANEIRIIAILHNMMDLKNHL